jgi:hypothetical protein
MSKEPIFNWPIAIALLLLIGFIALMKFGLYQALAAWGFGPFAILCSSIIVFAIAAAFAYDRWSARSRELPPPGRNDRRS